MVCSTGTRMYLLYCKHSVLETTVRLGMRLHPIGFSYLPGNPGSTSPLHWLQTDTISHSMHCIILRKLTISQTLLKTPTPICGSHTHTPTHTHTHTLASVSVYPMIYNRRNMPCNLPSLSANRCYPVTDTGGVLLPNSHRPQLSIPPWDAANLRV